MADPPSARTLVRRMSERGAYDRATIDAIVDEALICHVAAIHDGYPIVIPTIHARIEDTLYLHGSPASRLLRGMRSGEQISVSITIIDGLVVARAAFHNSMNYRSVVVFGEPRIVTDEAEKRAAMEAVVEHVFPGRWRESRPMTDREFATTLIAALPLDEASAKIRSGPPKDEDFDYRLPIWAGVLPIGLDVGEPIADPALEADVPIPPSIAGYRRPIAT